MGVFAQIFAVGGADGDPENFVVRNFATCEISQVANFRRLRNFVTLFQVAKFSSCALFLVQYSLIFGFFVQPALFHFFLSFIYIYIYIYIYI